MSGPANPVTCRAQIGFKPRGIEPQRGRRLLGAGKSLLAVDGGHGSLFVIPGRAEGADPESRNSFGARLWIPGSLASLAPRNDGSDHFFPPKEIGASA